MISDIPSLALTTAEDHRYADAAHWETGAALLPTSGGIRQGNPLRYRDPSGEIDPFDIAFLALDAVALANDYNAIRREGWTSANTANLAIDVAATALDMALLAAPGVGGGGHLGGGAVKLALAGVHGGEVAVATARVGMRAGQYGLHAWQAGAHAGVGLRMLAAAGTPEGTEGQSQGPGQCRPEYSAIDPPTDRSGLRHAMGEPPHGMVNPQAQHDLPWDFREWFAGEGRGLNVNDPSYGRWVEGNPPGRHQNWSREYNLERKDFIAQNPNASRSDVLGFLDQLRASGRFE
ncbi:MAG: hypothetical protein ACUVX9_11025 [Anaerolineae bacterium]